MTVIPLLEETVAIRAARGKWRYTGKQRPSFAEPTHSLQESVWDYPRPPRCEVVQALVEVRANGVTLAQTHSARRVLETAGAPTYYLPPQDVDLARLAFTQQGSICEWKGRAQGIDVIGPGGVSVASAGWRYVEMFAEFAHLHEWCAFYPQRVECFVGAERATAQPGGYYGGWVTANLAGPIKGGPNSSSW